MNKKLENKLKEDKEIDRVKLAKMSKSPDVEVGTMCGVVDDYDGLIAQSIHANREGVNHEETWNPRSTNEDYKDDNGKYIVESDESEEVDNDLGYANLGYDEAMLAMYMQEFNDSVADKEREKEEEMMNAVFRHANSRLVSDEKKSIPSESELKRTKDLFPSLYELKQIDKHDLNLVRCTKSVYVGSEEILEGVYSRDLKEMSERLMSTYSPICSACNYVFNLSSLHGDSFKELIEFLFCENINELILGYNNMNKAVKDFNKLFFGSAEDCKFYIDNRKVSNLIVCCMCDLRGVFEHLNVYFNAMFEVPFITYRLDGSIVSLFDVVDEPNCSSLDLNSFESLVATKGSLLKEKMARKIFEEINM